MVRAAMERDMRSSVTEVATPPGDPRSSFGGRGGRSRSPGRAHLASALPGAREPAAAAAPHFPLIRLHRHSLSHLLLVGGAAGERERLAVAFHRGSPIRRGPFVRLEAPRDEDRLRCALEHALSAVTCERPDNPLRESEGGTLFLDRVTQLSLATQRVLLRVLASLPAAASGPCFGRLAVGSDEPLEDAAAAGRFHAALFDILDKIRVDLRSPGPAGAR
jgi:DNA-binding NtrC family response regulator